MADFPVAEFEARTARAQRMMAAAGLGALLLCTEAEVRYFTGFRTLFWQSPTRPWFVILPRDGAPIAVIPEIGAALMQTTWITDIRTFAAPSAGSPHIALLAEALAGCSQVGLPMGEEASLRLPLLEFNALVAATPARFVDCSALIKDLRMVKSTAEIAIIHDICTIASRAFDRAPQLFNVGQPLSEVFRAFKIALLGEGAEDVPYLVGGAGPDGYSDVISPPSGRPLQRGDILMLDTGATKQGYFCDFDRNFAIGTASHTARRAHQTLWHATQAGLDSARPGATAAQIFAAMQGVLGGGSDVGRLGHGLGMQLTEWPSLAAHDTTPITAGMVLTLEPSLSYGAGLMMVHEENILITDGPPEVLTKRTPVDLPVI